AVAGACDLICGCSVAGDHDAAISRVKAKGVGVVPCSMRDGKSMHGNVCVFVDQPRMNLMSVDLVRFGVAMLQPLRSHGYIFYIGSLNMPRHGGDAWRTV